MPHIYSLGGVLVCKEEWEKARGIVKDEGFTKAVAKVKQKEGSNPQPGKKEVKQESPKRRGRPKKGDK